MYHGPGFLPATGVAAGPLALLFTGASLFAYVLLGMALVIAGFVLLRSRYTRRTAHD